MKIAILTVPYLKTDVHKSLAKNAYKTFGAYYKYAVVNYAQDLDFVENYNSDYEINDKNILARAWNKGLKHLFSLGYTHVTVPNLDVRFKTYSMSRLIDFIKKNPEAGVWSMMAVNDLMIFKMSDRTLEGGQPIKHHDQSFSCYTISKKAFEDIGDFNEDFIPCYCEDNDYLERAFKKNYQPMMCLEAPFYHAVQATVKFTTEDDQQSYPEYLQRNINLFRQLHGDKIADRVHGRT